MPNSDSPIIGIDYGTTKSIAAVMARGQAQVLPLGRRESSIASVVRIDENDNFYVGDDIEAMSAATRWSARHVSIDSIKRDLGRLGSRSWGRHHGYPQELAALVLSRVKMGAEAYLGVPVSEAVIAVPASWNLNQCSAIREAAMIAGLSIRRLVHEPTAAAIAYAAGSGRHETIAVFDLGGGTFDISVLEVDTHVVQVLATGGDDATGGCDIDKALADRAAAKLRSEHGFFLADNPQAYARVMDEVRRAKHDLSTCTWTTVNVPYINTAPVIHFQMALARTDIEELSAPMLERIGCACKETLAVAEMTPNDIERVILVGGSTRMPMVRALAQEIFNRIPVASLDPIESVAVGAATYGAMLQGDLRGLVVDVTPAAIGLAAADGNTIPLIARGSPIPARAVTAVQVANPAAAEALIRVVQGKAAEANDNQFVGAIKLKSRNGSGLGTADIRVILEVDVNGRVHAEASCSSTDGAISANLEAEPHAIGAAKIAAMGSIIQDRMARVREELLKVGETRRRQAAVKRAREILRAVAAHSHALSGLVAGNRIANISESAAAVLDRYIEFDCDASSIEKLSDAIVHETVDIIAAARWHLVEMVCASAVGSAWMAGLPYGTRTGIACNDALSKLAEFAGSHYGTLVSLRELEGVCSGPSVEAWPAGTMSETSGHKALYVVMCVAAGVAVPWVSPPPGRRLGPLDRLLIHLQVSRRSWSREAHRSALALALDLAEDPGALIEVIDDANRDPWRIWVLAAIPKAPPGTWVDCAEKSSLQQLEKIVHTVELQNVVAADVVATAEVGGQAHRRTLMSLLEVMPQMVLADPLGAVLRSSRDLEEQYALLKIARERGIILPCELVTEFVLSESSTVCIAALDVLRVACGHADPTANRVLSIAQKELVDHGGASWSERRALRAVGNSTHALALLARRLGSRRR